jgi:hypothetical protein
MEQSLHLEANSSTTSHDIPTKINIFLTYVIVYQYSKTNVMHFLFSLLSIKGPYVFRALLAPPQEALRKR